MPDLDKYSPNTPFVPQDFGKVNLSDVFIPSVDLPTVNTPNTDSGDGGGDNAWSFLLKKTGRNPFAGLGIVPAGPAAVDDYYTNRKFTSEADSYQFGSKYKDLGFLIGRDNEDLFAKHESIFGEAFNATVRLLDKTGAYALQGFGFLGGLVGIGNKHNNYHSGSGFANWIAGASDNALALWGKGWADNVDNIYRPIYNEAADRNKGFFKRMISDAEFWTGDVVDGAAFLGSAYLTSGLGKILDLGTKAVRATASLRGLNFADEATALSTEGLAGMSESTSLSGGATAIEGGAQAVPNAFSPTAGQVISQVSKEAGNFANARKINMYVSALINTGSEAMFEASNLKDETVDKLLAAKNPDGSAKYTPEQAKNISARGARNSFLLNMLVLMPSNLWETRIFYGKANSSAVRNAESSLIRRGTGLLDKAEIAKRTFGQKGLSYLKNLGEGIVAEGLWEENIQLAIERMNQDQENIDSGFFTNIGKVLNQYGKQTSAAFSGNDSEAAMNIGLGGLIGGGMGFVSHVRDVKAIKRDVTNFNSFINHFRATAKDLYEKDGDGNVKLDSNGLPVINTKNVLSYISSMDKTLKVSELADNLKDKHMDILHSIVDNENIAKLIKGYADHGLADDLIQKLEDAKGFKPEDLMLLGLNPNKKDNTTRLDDIKKKATSYKNIYDNIEKNFIVRLRNDDRYGSKARLMKDKLYYLSTRAQNLDELKKQVDTRKETSSSEIALRYNGENDSLVDRLNDLYTNYTSSKKRADYLSSEQRRITDGRLGLNDNTEETIPIKEGVTLTRKKPRKVAPQEQYTGTDEQDLSDAMSAVTNSEKEFKDFLEENKDSLKNIKKNADGSFRYEIPEKNRLMYDEGVMKDQNISKDLEMSRNATLNVFNRISDIKYGERYFDQKYTKNQQALASQIVNDEDDQVEENLQDEPTPPPEGPQTAGEEQPTREPIRSREEENDAVDELNELKREKESLQKEDATLEDEARIDEIDKQIKDIEDNLDGIDDSRVESEIGGSTNIPIEKKEDYKEVLKQIEKNKRRVIKRDGFYEIDGEKYGKVSDLIGNVVPEELRSGLQNALAAGYTVDSVVKAYFDGTLNSEDFKNQIATKISEDALNRLTKQLDVISNKLNDDGIEIVASNVVTWDPILKVAGEIDILGVDKKGNFKIFEIEARQGRIWAQIATKTGRGPAIYEMSQKQLSAYRNLFANQYGHVPNNISVLFPVDVKYDKTNTSGFIDDVKLKREIRYTPTANVQIKSKIFQPIRIGSKYDGYDMTSLFINSFIPKTLENAKDKLRFLLRNEKFETIKKGLVLKVKEAEQSFQDAYNNQQRIIAGESVDGYKIEKHPQLNLYSLKGNKEIKLEYNGQLIGFMQPMPTLAYKDEAGKFHSLDENTALDIYKEVTGNSEQTYGEFTNITKAYKSAYNSLIEQIKAGEETTIPNADLQKMFDIQMSYGELDLVGVGKARPDLNDLVVNGIKVGNKSVVTVINLDENDAVRVMMDKNTRSKNTGKKFQEVDSWANANLENLKKVMTNKSGERVTNYVAVVETPDGKFHPLALRQKADAKLSETEDYIPDLGSKFTSSTSKNVFKNENVALIPKNSAGTEANIKLKGDNIISDIFTAEDINSLEKFGLDITEVTSSRSVDESIGDFISSLNDFQLKKVNSLFAAYSLTNDELKTELIDDFNAGNWSSMEDYLEQIKCDL